MWFFNSDIFKREFKNCPIVYVAHAGNTIEKLKNFRRLLELSGVEVERTRPITQPTTFEKIILPDESFFRENGLKFTKEYRETIDSVRSFAIKNRTPTANQKIYYFHGSRQIGEERLAEYFKSKGYAIIRPEKLTLDEQLNLLINCESFASALGSTSHNSIFLREGIESIFIPRVVNNFNDYQSLLNQVHPVNSNYIDSTLSIFYKNAFNVFYLLSPQLKRFFGDKFSGYEEEDFKNFLRYVKNSIARELDPSQLNAYGEVFQNFIEQLKRHEDLIKAYVMTSFDWDKFQPKLIYQTHVSDRGWRDGWKDADQISNPLDQKRQIEALKMDFPIYKLYYSVYYNDKEGWSEEVLAPEMAGTTGQFKAIYGIRIRLDEAGAKKFDIFYRVHNFDDMWTAWAKNGETIYSHGVKLNAIQIKLEPRT